MREKERTLTVTTETQSQTRQVVRSFFDAWTRGDLVATREYLADDLVFTGTLKSLQGASEYVAALRDFRQLITTGNDLISDLYSDHEATLMYHSYTLAGMIRMAEHIRLTNGKISSIVLIFDPTALVAFKASMGQGK